jgi:hypothetical protein
MGTGEAGAGQRPAERGTDGEQEHPEDGDDEGGGERLAPPAGDDQEGRDGGREQPLAQGQDADRAGEVVLVPGQQQEEAEPQDRPQQPDDGEGPVTDHQPGVDGEPHGGSGHDQGEPAEPLTRPAGDAVDPHPQVGEAEVVEPGGERDLRLVAVRGDDEVGRRDHLEPADEEVQRCGAGRAHVSQQHDAVDHQHGTDVEQADGAHGSPARQ